MTGAGPAIPDVLDIAPSAPPSDVTPMRCMRCTLVKERIEGSDELNRGYQLAISREVPCTCNRST